MAKEANTKRSLLTVLSSKSPSSCEQRLKKLERSTTSLISILIVKQFFSLVRFSDKCEKMVHSNDPVVTVAYLNFTEMHLQDKEVGTVETPSFLH